MCTNPQAALRPVPQCGPNSNPCAGARIFRCSNPLRIKTSLKHPRSFFGGFDRSPRFLKQRRDNSRWSSADPGVILLMNPRSMVLVLGLHGAPRYNVPITPWNTCFSCKDKSKVSEKGLMKCCTRVNSVQEQYNDDQLHNKYQNKSNLMFHHFSNTDWIGSRFQ